MTAVARSRRGHVGGRLPTSLHSVMTGGATARRHPEVPKGRAGPTHHPMAAVARHGCRNMGRRLSLNRTVVMTLRAGARRNAIMGKESRFPVRGSVTAITIHRGGQVIRGLKCRHDPSTRRMALHTLRRRSTKDALQVTALTLDLRMAAGQGKACCAMIDFDICTVAPLCRHPTRQDKARQ